MRERRRIGRGWCCTGTVSRQSMQRPPAWEAALTAIQPHALRKGSIAVHEWQTCFTNMINWSCRPTDRGLFTLGLILLDELRRRVTEAPSAPELPKWVPSEVPVPPVLVLLPSCSTVGECADACDSRRRSCQQPSYSPRSSGRSSWVETCHRGSSAEHATKTVGSYLGLDAAGGRRGERRSVRCQALETACAAV